MNDKMELLQSREDPKTVVAKRYTLGTTEALDRSLTVNRKRRPYEPSISDTSLYSYPKSSDEEGMYRAELTADSPRQELVWDYQSGWDGRRQDEEEEELDLILKPGKPHFSNM